MKTQRGFWMIAGALLLGTASASHAQETLGGLGAAGAMGATLGAAGAGGLSANRATRNLPAAPGDAAEDTGGAPSPGGASAPGGGVGAGVGGTTTTTTTTVVRPPAPQIFSGTGSEFVNELMAAPSPPARTSPRTRGSARAQARYAARVARMSKTQRTRRVQAKYKIAPVGWEAAYLPQDRYKFGKVWRFVSTETDRFYYTPSGMARRRFNPNRVIGFNSYQDALLAGYRPDPVTRPAPGAQIAYLARLSRGPELNDFVEYVYAGQISPDTLNAVYNYALTVERTLKPTRARPYIGSTVAKVLEAALTGDTSSIPTKFNERGPIVTVTTTTTVAPGGGPAMPGMTPPRANLMPPSTTDASSSGGDKRTDEFNGFSNRAGNLANVPANRR